MHSGSSMHLLQLCPCNPSTHRMPVKRNNLSFLFFSFTFAIVHVDVTRNPSSKITYRDSSSFSMDASHMTAICSLRWACGSSQTPLSPKSVLFSFPSLPRLQTLGKEFQIERRLARRSTVSPCAWHGQRSRQYFPASVAHDLNALTEQKNVKKDLLIEGNNDALGTGVHEPPAPAKESVPSSISAQQGTEEEYVEEDSSLQRGEKLVPVDVAEGKLRTKLSFNIVFVSAEVAPYSKTGGLGDVCGCLPISLAARGHRVMAISPRYRNAVTAEKFSGAFDTQCRTKITCFGGEHEVAFFHEYRAGVDWVFIDHPSYHRPGNPYGDDFGAFGDNQFRFTLLCHAACEAPLLLPLGGFTYGEKCLFIANDWHAGLVPILLAAKYRPHGVYRHARSILSIHNLAHQGVEPATTYGNLGLPSDWYGALEWVFPTWARKHALDRGEAVNHLKGAIVTADRILTVSQGYAWEITTQEGGWGLDELLRSRKFIINGITNGVDADEWNPSIDKYIACHYSVEDLSGKAECKTALQKELGLSVRPDVPLIGFIGRLDYQKGVDLIQSALPDLMQDDIQLVMLGSGDLSIESWMRMSESTYRDKFRGWVGFSIPVAHKITAGCDILLMPSRFEPCGLNQLYAMRYGTVPVVHCTGGLRDTVDDFNPFANDGAGVGTGWRFSPLSKEAMLGTLKIAMQTYREYKSSWRGIMKRGMLQDFSWDNAASQYEQIIEWAMKDPPYV